MDRVTKLVTALAVAIIPLATAHAFTKCQRGNKVLYTQEWDCPSGYHAVTAAAGTVSTVSKSDAVRQQEKNFLASRAVTPSITAPELSTATYGQASSQSGLCSGLAEQASAIEASMRQPNASPWQDSLRQQHRTIRDQQYRLGC